MDIGSLVDDSAIVRVCGNRAENIVQQWMIVLIVLSYK